MMLALIILLLVPQFMSQLDCVDGTTNSSQQQLQECLDGGVTDLASNNPLCADNIGRFLTVARDQSENYTLPQDVIDGICSSTCYDNMTQIYFNCTKILLVNINSIDVICKLPSPQLHDNEQKCNENLQNYQLPQQLNDGICNITNFWDECPPGCSEVLTRQVDKTGCCDGQTLLIHAVNNIDEFKRTSYVYGACGRFLPEACPILREIDSGGGGGGSGSFTTKQLCIINKIADVASRDASCADKIGRFINATQTFISKQGYDYDEDDYSHTAYASSYYLYDFNVPQRIIDGVCTSKCRNEFNTLHRQCADDLYVDNPQLVCTSRNDQNCAQALNEFTQLSEVQQVNVNAVGVCNTTAIGQCSPACAEALGFSFKHLGCCYAEVLDILMSIDNGTYQATINAHKICGQSLPKPCSVTTQNGSCNGWAVNGTLMIILVILASLPMP